MTSAKLITFEGIDGSGKSTQIAALTDWLASRSLEVVQTREPGGSVVGEKIREVLLSEPMSLMTETLLFFAARAEHVEKKIAPALSRGAWVISDRFTDATYAYQVGAKAMDAERILELERLVLGNFKPYRTFLFDISPEVAAARRVAQARTADRFELEDSAFFERVRNAYLARAQKDPERFVIIDASQSREAITECILKEAAQWLQV